MNIRTGTNIQMLPILINEALKGQVCCFCTPVGDIAIIKWEEYERLKRLDDTDQIISNMK